MEWRIDEPDNVGVNLPERHEGQRLVGHLAYRRAELSQKCGAVALDSSSGVVFGESQVERIAPVGRENPPTRVENP